MKKLLALLLAILMIASIALVSCKAEKQGTNGSNGGDADNTEDDGGFVVPNAGSTSTDSIGSDTSDNEGDNDNDYSDEETVTEFSVYTYTDTNIRTEAKMSSRSDTTVKASTKLTVIASQGVWYKVKYGEIEGYVPKDFVSINENDTIFDKLPEAEYKTITIKGSGDDKPMVNIRTYPIYSDLLDSKITLDYTMTEGGTLKKIGENKSGNWYMVSYTSEGKTGTYYLKLVNDTITNILVDGQPIKTDAGGI